jgi:hypothetical protein
VQLQKDFPQSEVGRVRLELLLSKLQGDKSLFGDNFEKLREPLMAAAKLDVVSAMEILGEGAAQARSKSILRLALRSSGARSGTCDGRSGIALLEWSRGGA